MISISNAPDRVRKPLPLPSVRKNHSTPLPSTPSFLVLSSSFGPTVAKQPSLWHQGAGFDLITSAGIIRVAGMTESENVSLQHYVIHELGTEGLKGLVAAIDTYRLLATGCDQLQNIDVTLKQLLQRIGSGAHAEDLDQQTQLLNTLLYLSRASVVDIPSKQVASPLLVLEKIMKEAKGRTWLSYRLGTDTFDAIYSPQHLWFPLPTDRVFEYHSSRDYYILQLTFFLGNRLAQGSYSCYFTALCMNGSLLSREQLLPPAKNRTRSALRIVSALLQLERDEFICLDPHPDLDVIFAANYHEESSEYRAVYYRSFTLQRLEQHILALRGKSRTELRTVRRQALQRLLNVEASREDWAELFPEWDTSITFHPGPQYLERQRKLATENEKRQQFLAKRLAQPITRDTGVKDLFCAGRILKRESVEVEESR
jgi:hypothetical protein